MFDKIWQIIKGFCSRTVILYVLAACLLLVFANFPRAWNHVVTSVLSRYMPDHQYLIDFDHDRTKFDPKKNKEFELYYRKVTELMPGLPDSYAMLGFCYFYEGRVDRAKTSYQQAVRIYPKVFNFYYNLGIVALKDQDAAEALEYFVTSVTIPPITNIEFIVSSQIYKPFIPRTKIAETLAMTMGQQTQDVYRRAYYQILTTAESLHDYPPMIKYSLVGVKQGFVDEGVGYYYAGLASYDLKDYAAGAQYMQEAIKKGFRYAQAFQVMGSCLKALGRPESAPALVAAASLTRDGKIFEPTKLNMELLIY